jgi:hypothetical protein
MVLLSSSVEIALLCLSLASWYFIPSCLITALPYTKTESFSVTPSSLHAVQNMSPSVYFSHGRPCIQLNWNDLCHFLPCMTSLWYFRNILNFQTQLLTFRTFLFKSLALGKIRNMCLYENMCLRHQFMRQYIVHKYVTCFGKYIVKNVRNCHKIEFFWKNILMIM